MKQHISLSQLQELTDEQQERLRGLWRPAKGDLYIFIGHSTPILIDSEEMAAFIAGRKDVVCPIHSIGQLIELLNSLKYKMQITKKLNPSSNRIELWWHDGGKRKFRYYGGSDLIDALWQAVKEVL